MGHIFDTGGLYNPLLDEWTPTNPIGAPTARGGHTAVWTGTEMIVWGGTNLQLGTYFNTGGRYTPGPWPGQGTWTSTNLAGAPSSRSGHVAVWTGSLMIVWGGQNFITLLNSGGRYNPGSNSWLPTSATNAPSARYYHTAVWTGKEMIVWGGYNGNYLPSGGLYSP